MSSLKLRTGKRVAQASMVASGALAITKIVIGTFGGSTSVVADGLESAGDVLASGVVMLGFIIATTQRTKIIHTDMGDLKRSPD